jgi:hypothetical protein
MPTSPTFLSRTPEPKAITRPSPQRARSSVPGSGELARLRKKIRELRREKDFFRLAAAHFAKKQLPPRGFG